MHPTHVHPLNIPSTSVQVRETSFPEKKGTILTLLKYVHNETDPVTFKEKLIKNCILPFNN
jgi:hypothetical protein